MRWLRLSLQFSVSLLSVTALLLLVLLALYASLGRLYMPKLAEKRDVIELYLKENVPFPIQFESLEGSWNQLSPRIRLSDLQADVPVKGRQWQFYARNVIVEIDVIQSLLYRRPALRDVLIEGGSVKMHGKPLLLSDDADHASSSGTTAMSEILGAALNLGVIQVLDSQLQLELPDMEQARVVTVSASLERSDNFRRLKVDARFADADPASIDLLIEANQFSGGDLSVVEAYGRWENVRLDHWLRSVDWGGDLQVARTISGEVWGHWVPGADIRVQGRVSAPAIGLTVKGKTWPALEDFSASFLMERSDDLQWNIEIAKMAFECQGVSVPWQDFAIQSVPGQPWRVQVGSVDLVGLHELLNTLDIGRDVLASVNPRGRLTSLSMTVSREEGGLDWRVNTYLDRVSIDSWNGAPAATGVTGYLTVNPAGGYVDLNAGNDFSMFFPGVYADAMHFSSARARVGWQVNAQGITVESSKILLKSQEGNAVGLLALDLPAAGSDRDAWMSLVIGLTDAPASARNKYIPMTLSPGLKQWLDTSIDAGTVAAGGFIFDGPLSDSARQPVVQLFLDMRQVNLRYQPDWPALNDIDGRLLVDDGRVTVWAKQAMLYDSSVRHAQVEVADDDSGNLQLSIQGNLQGPTQNVVRLLNNSPLHAAVGSALDGWDVDGPFDATLLLGISLEAPAEPYVEVDAVLHKNRLSLTHQHLQFDALDGGLSYDSDRGLISPALVAELWGAPLQASIESQWVAGGMDMRIHAQGQASMANVRRWMNWPWLSFAEGQTALTAELIVQPDLPPQLILHSDLQGVRVDLPAPFAKTAKQTWPFRATIPLSGTDAMMDVAVGKDLRIAVLPMADEPSWIALALGNVPFRIPQSPGVTVYGRLDQFDWSAWQPPIEKLISAFNTPETTSDSTDSQFRVSGVYVSELTLFDQSYHSILTSVHQLDQRWWIGFQGETLAGRVGLPKADEPVLIKLDRLYFDGMTPETLVADAHQDDASAAASDATHASADVAMIPDTPDPLLDLDWSQWPDMVVEIADVKVGKADFGQWGFSVVPRPGTLRVEKLKVKSAVLRIDADDDGAWVEWVRQGDDAGHTSLHGSVLIHDLDQVFHALGIDPSMNAAESVMSFDLNWPGSPLRPSIEGMQGHVGGSFKNGFIKAGSRTQTGMLKVLSVFNLNTILKRIKLDFSDLRQQGLAFDDAKAKLAVAEGWITLTEPLTINGPSSTIVLQGRVDMINDTLDNRLTVTLPVASSVPWLVALAGGLPAAVGVYIASKVLQKQVNSFTSVVYEISGSTSDPQVKFQRLFDTDSLLPSWMSRSDKKSSDEKSVAEPSTADESPAAEQDAVIEAAP